MLSRAYKALKYKHFSANDMILQYILNLIFILSSCEDSDSSQFKFFDPIVDIEFFMIFNNINMVKEIPNVEVDVV